jgi:hypothetical protein
LIIDLAKISAFPQPFLVIRCRLFAISRLDFEIAEVLCAMARPEIGHKRRAPLLDVSLVVQRAQWVPAALSCGRFSD